MQNLNLGLSELGNHGESIIPFESFLSEQV